jgi:hypothetical protein
MGRMSAAGIASSDEVDVDRILAGRTTVTLTPILARAVPAYVRAETSRGASANSSAVRTRGVVAERTPVLSSRSKKRPHRNLCSGGAESRRNARSGSKRGGALNQRGIHSAQRLQVPSGSYRQVPESMTSPSSL